jgi:hypothetical protein
MTPQSLHNPLPTRVALQGAAVGSTTGPYRVGSDGPSLEQYDEEGRPSCDALKTCAGSFELSRFGFDGCGAL